jgi:site-specific recombinase XerD
MVKDMCSEANIEGKTNHSLRATGATTLFQKNVPERVIQKVTGHRSLHTLRSYEKISTAQREDVSKIIMTNKHNSANTDISEQFAGFMGGINCCSINLA